MFELKVDLHVHTEHSDSISSVNEVLESARLRRMDGIAITDHETMAGVKEALKLAQGLIIIPGIEIERGEGHLLVLGLKEAPPKYLDEPEVAEYSRQRGGVLIVAHPNTPFHRFDEEIIRRIKPDAIETHNAKTPLSRFMTARNIALARRMGLPETGGSDSHMRQTVGDMYTIVKSESRTVKGVLEAIQIGNVRPAGRPSPLWERSLWLAQTIYRRILGLRKVSDQLWQS